jgi:DNA (cytosine-5)-methyltransferase 1
MRVLDLFSGIGGFSLGLERAGFTTVAFCEIEPFCRAVLKKHWPHVPCYEDVRTLTAHRLRADGISVDVICGGFPCQDISFAGKGAGIEGERSGLWREYARLIGELRPRYVIVENVAALLGRGLDVVLGDLATLGFDAEWHCISASDIDAAQERERLWLVANRQGINGQSNGPIIRGEVSAGVRAWWASEPRVVRVAHGVPSRVDRLRALGNAVVPQIPEIIGRAILAAEAA